MTVSFLAEGRELALPVAPMPIGWGAGKQISTVTINGVGDVPIPGDPADHEETLYCLLPAHEYPFLAPGAEANPYQYIQTLRRWAEEKVVVRYIAEDVINTLVLISEVTWREQDGTGDVYATIYLRRHVSPEAVTTQVNAQTGNAGRTEPEEESQTVQSYTVVSGDCLSVICRRYYGSGTAAWYNALARYNGIKNPHLIFPGQALAIPPASQLGVSR